MKRRRWIAYLVAVQAALAVLAWLRLGAAMPVVMTFILRRVSPGSHLALATTLSAQPGELRSPAPVFRNGA